MRTPTYDDHHAIRQRPSGRHRRDVDRVIPVARGDQYHRRAEIQDRRIDDHGIG